MKKIISSLILVILIFQVVFTNFSYAADDDDIMGDFDLDEEMSSYVDSALDGLVRHNFLWTKASFHYRRFRVRSNTNSSG